MRGILTILSRTIVQTNTVFPVTVSVSSATPNAEAVVRLWQTAGIDPPFVARKTVQLDMDGEGAVTFEVSLNGPCLATLTAEDEGGGPLVPDTQRVRVVP